MDRTLEDIQNISSAIFGKYNVDISIDKDVYTYLIRKEDNNESSCRITSVPFNWGNYYISYLFSIFYIL